MGRILAIDYGTKRTGIAVTDPLKIISTGLTTISTHVLLDYLNKYFERESIERVVIGLPKQMNNELSDNMTNIKQFIYKFEQRFPKIPFVLYDERFTSVIAKRAVIESGIKKKDRQNKAIIDEISATIILQDYMESRAYKEIDL